MNKKNMNSHFYLRQLKQTAIIILLLLLFAGCRDESIAPDTPGNIELPGGQVAYTLYTVAPQFERLATRTGTADEDNAEGTMWVFVFDASTTDTLFVEAVKASGHEPAGTGASKRTVILQARTTPVTLFVLDNTPTHYFNGTIDVPITDDPASWGLTTATRLSEARTQLNTVHLAAPSVSTLPYTPTLKIPLSAEVHRDKLDASTEFGTEAAPFGLLRTVARLTVKKDFRTEEGYTPPAFNLKGATVYNAPRNASLFPVHKSNAGNLTNYIGSTGSEITDIAAATAYGTDPAGTTTEANPIYLYPSVESSTANQSFVLIQADYNNDGYDTYYKLAIAPAGKPVGQVDRNTAYRLLIKGCTGRGYATIDEAIAAPPSNVITYNMEVTDLTSHDILDNGQYFLAFSNSEYMFFMTGAATNLTVTTLSYKKTTGVTGSVTVTDVVGGTNPNPTITRNPFTVSGATDTSEDLNMTFPSTFRSCVLVVRYGNLTQRIPITRRYTLPSSPIVQKQFATPDADYVYGTVEFPVGTPHWVGLSADTLPEIFGLDVISTNEKGKLYLKLRSNHEEVLAPGDTLWAVNRYATMYLSRSTNKGRLKVYMQQDALNMARLNDTSDPGFVPVVGAFWRANQTGERLVQITKTNITGSVRLGGYWYTSNVYYGDNWDPDNGDGVRVDNLPSPDTKVWTADGPTKSGNDTDFDTDYPVTKSQFAEGEMTPDADGRIYFRIGLEKPYIPTAAYPARYALVVLAYTANGSEMRYQRMFIRQGEEADYLMRPQDKYDNTQTWASAPIWRPNAVKFLPYNLTDPSGFPSTTYANMTKIPLRGSANDHQKLTAYPTQAGALFLYSFQRVAMPPTYTGTATYDTSFASEWNSATEETCPAGYRRPNCGAVGSGNNDGFRNADAQSSEMRQSLWYAPPKGNLIDNNINTLRGYYADGFFDRRKIVSSWTYLRGSVSSTIQYTTVESGNNVAYYGALLFNPNNYASLFFPAAGRRRTNGEVLDFAGESGLYWSSTITNGSAAGTTTYGNEANSFNFGNGFTSAGGSKYSSGGTCIVSWNRYRGGSVRCVKDE